MGTLLYKKFLNEAKAVEDYEVPSSNMSLTRSSVNSTTKPIYTCSRVDERVELLNSPALLAKFWYGSTSKPALSQLEYKINCSQERNFGGAFRGVRFRVETHDIYLHELGFHGPMFEAKAEYNVHVELYRPKQREILPNTSSILLKKKINKILAVQNEIFTIGFDNIHIERGVWYLIEFKLDGPPMNCCRDVIDALTIPIMNGQHVDFSFTSSSSKQLPEIRFIV